MRRPDKWFVLGIPQPAGRFTFEIHSRCFPVGVSSMWSTMSTCVSTSSPSVLLKWALTAAASSCVSPEERPVFGTTLTITWSSSSWGVLGTPYLIQFHERIWLRLSPDTAQFGTASFEESEISKVSPQFTR